MNQSPVLDPEEQKCLADIAEHGCHVLLIWDEELKEIDFAYSVGLPVSVGQPEVLVYGLGREIMHFMINEICRQCAEGLVLSDGLRIHDLLEGHDCIARWCTNGEAIKEHLGWALWYHRTQRGVDVEGFYQIVWPGAASGLFPWDEGVSQDVIEAQPALYESVQ
ncbi:MAG: DUF4262 domain-containing protein [Erythrobacter sp.]|nr:DUF4262 domain-containing protein [Erythrobacter sp.]MBA4082474.1 DUF4262 domain-containing protein [Erythrobacter sp.]